MVGNGLRVGLLAVGCVVVFGCASREADSSSARAQALGSGIAVKAANPPTRMIDDPPAKPGGADATKAIPCATRDVVLKPGGNGDDFNGMSHSGTYLTLTNRSRNACSVPGLPQLTFLDANGPVKADADLPGAKFMHPGPVVLPLVLQPKQSVTTSARWVSGPVYADNLCYKLTGVTVALRTGSAMMPLVGQMCGDKSKGVRYELKRYGAAE